MSSLQADCSTRKGWHGSGGFCCSTKVAPTLTPDAVDSQVSPVDHVGCAASVNQDFATLCTARAQRLVCQQAAVQVQREGVSPVILPAEPCRMRCTPAAASHHAAPQSRSPRQAPGRRP
eukprot:366112-Chlamydomonas_euryale.AAC.12